MKLKKMIKKISDIWFGPRQIVDYTVSVFWTIHIFYDNSKLVGCLKFPTNNVFFLFQELLSYNSITPPALEVWLVIFHYPVLLILQSALYNIDIQ